MAKLGRPPKACPEDVRPLLGVLTVEALTQMAGVSARAVRRWRSEVGIPAAARAARTPRPKRQFAPPVPPAIRAVRETTIRAMWEDHSLEEIGATLGLTRERVRQLSTTMGLPRKRDARKANGRRKQAIRQAVREGRDIRGSGSSRKIAEVETLLGVVSDYEIAARIGVAPQAVHHYRTRAGIDGVGRAGGSQVHTKGKAALAYKLRQRGAKWRDISIRLRLTNACRGACDYAKRNGLPWPIALEEK